MPRNIFKDISIPETGETLLTVLNQKNVTIEVIASSDILPGTVYNQKHDEWVLLLEGAAKLELDDRTMSLVKGDHVYIDSGKPHKVLETEKGTLWLAVHIY